MCFANMHVDHKYLSSSKPGAARPYHLLERLVIDGEADAGPIRNRDMALLDDVALLHVLLPSGGALGWMPPVPFLDQEVGHCRHGVAGGHHSDRRRLAV